MAIRYPIIIIGIVIVIVAITIIFKKRKKTFSKGTKIANTSFIKNNEYYKQKVKEYRLLSNILKGLCLLSIVISALLLSRVSKVETVNESEYKRDIFLCMDVSGSVDDLNYEIAKNLQEIVKSLKGERFGISIFNSSSVVLVPLTNDYDYVLESLSKLEKGFHSMKDKDAYSIEENIDLYYYISSGTLDGQGGSLIGDGLTSCVFSFPDLEEDKERTRITILTTDNELSGPPLVTLEEAANIAKKKNVKIYGVATETITTKNANAFKAATKVTGGEYYEQGKSSVKEIVKGIEKQSKSLIDDNTQTYQIDIPQIPFITLLLSICILIYLDSKVIS